ncbi:MAG: S41 family peptidase, partial [Nannocystaceae bacterium]
MVGLLFLGGVFGASLGEAARQRSFDRAMFHDAMDVVLDRYVDRVESPTSLRANLDGFVSNLDPYSYVLDPEDARGAHRGDEGLQSAGVGAAFVLRRRPRDSARIEVASVRRDGPAARLGVRPGDEVLTLNGKDASFFAHQGRLDRYLQSAADASLRVVLRSRDGGSSREVTVARVPMDPPDLVEVSLVTVGDKRLVWLQIRTFLAGTQRAVEAAFGGDSRPSDEP